MLQRGGKYKAACLHALHASVKTDYAKKINNAPETHHATNPPSSFIEILIRSSLLPVSANSKYCCCHDLACMVLRVVAQRSHRARVQYVQVTKIFQTVFQCRSDIGDVIVDANDLSTLAGDRYLTGFVIDAACLKFSEEAISRGSISLYVPTFTQTLASSGSLHDLTSKIGPHVGGRDFSSIVWVLTPVHVISRFHPTA